MENASKALIIAGAILLSILLISLGIGVVRIAQGAIQGINLDPQKVQAYNSEFEQYANVQAGTSVRSLCDAIRQHNNAHVNDASLNIDIALIDGTITATDGNYAFSGSNAPATSSPTTAVTAATVNTAKNKIRAGNTYYVEFGYDSSSGYIVDCHIQKVN